MSPLLFFVLTLVIGAAMYIVRTRPLERRLVQFLTIALAVIWGLMLLSVLGVFRGLATV